MGSLTGFLPGSRVVKMGEEVSLSKVCFLCSMNSSLQHHQCFVLTEFLLVRINSQKTSPAESLLLSNELKKVHKGVRSATETQKTLNKYTEAQHSYWQRRELETQRTRKTCSYNDKSHKGTMHAHFVYIHTFRTKGQSVRGNKNICIAGPYVDFDYAAISFLCNRNSRDKESVKLDDQVHWHLFFHLCRNKEQKQQSTSLSPKIF